MPLCISAGYVAVHCQLERHVKNAPSAAQKRVDTDRREEEMPHDEKSYSLTPCPFCGCVACMVSQDIHGSYHVRCELCKAEGPCAERPDVAKECWNRRANDDDLK